MPSPSQRIAVFSFQLTLQPFLQSAGASIAFQWIALSLSLTDLEPVILIYTKYQFFDTGLLYIFQYTL
jgi:hypothetical protein